MLKRFVFLIIALLVIAGVGMSVNGLTDFAVDRVDKIKNDTNSEIGEVFHTVILDNTVGFSDAYIDGVFMSLEMDEIYTFEMKRGVILDFDADYEEFFDQLAESGVYIVSCGYSLDAISGNIIVDGHEIDDPEYFEYGDLFIYTLSGIPAEEILSQL